MVAQGGEAGGHRSTWVKRPREEAAIATLRKIAAAESTRRAQQGRFATIEDLQAAGQVAKTLSAGYRFAVTVSPDGQRFTAVATPAEYGVSGARSFFVDQTNVVRAADKKGGPASSTDAPVDEAPDGCATLEGA